MKRQLELELIEEKASKKNKNFVTLCPSLFNPFFKNSFISKKKGRI